MLETLGRLFEQDTVVANVDAVENQPLMIKQAVKYITEREKNEQPFFLYFPMCPPHSPIAPADDMKGKGGISDKEARYGDWVYQGDHMLGPYIRHTQANRPNARYTHHCHRRQWRCKTTVPSIA